RHCQGKGDNHSLDHRLAILLQRLLMAPATKYIFVDSWHRAIPKPCLPVGMEGSWQFAASIGAHLRPPKERLGRGQRMEADACPAFAPERDCKVRLCIRVGCCQIMKNRQTSTRPLLP